MTLCIPHKNWRTVQKPHEFFVKANTCNTIINANLLISGILPSVHPTKDQLQTMHQESAV